MTHTYDFKVTVFDIDYSGPYAMVSGSSVYVFPNLEFENPVFCGGIIHYPFNGDLENPVFLGCVRDIVSKLGKDIVYSEFGKGIGESLDSVFLENTIEQN